MRRRNPKPLHLDPGSEVYAHFKALVQSICRKAVFLGYDPQDAESAAGWGFVLAVNSYDPDKGQIDVWIRYKVTKEITSLKRQKAYKRLPLTDDPELFDPPAPEDEDEEFDITPLLLGLSDDAASWVSLVLDPPESVQEKAAELGWPHGGGYKGSASYAYRQAVFEWFRQAGWSDKRITTAYLEACRALGGKPT